MNRIAHGLLSVGLLLAASVAHGQAPGTFTTLPRPSEPVPAPPTNASAAPPPTASAPAAVPPGTIPPTIGIETAPPLPPIGALASPPEVVLPHVPFYKRIRADLLEVGILFPSVDQNVNADVMVGLNPTNIALPSAGLGFAAPVLLNVQFDAWRYGEINANFRYLAAEGNEILGGFDPAGPAILRSRLDMNRVDVSFASSGYGPLWNLLWFVNEDPIVPKWGLRWDVGGRFETIFFDSRAIGPQRERQVTNFFVGGGPHVGLTLHRMLRDGGLMLFGRADFGANMGTVRQQFAELTRDAGGNPVAFGYFARSNTTSAPTLAVEAGVSAQPPFTPRGRWQVAYRFEQWWNIGYAPDSYAHLQMHGVMLRWWFCY